MRYLVVALLLMFAALNYLLARPFLIMGKLLNFGAGKLLTPPPAPTPSAENSRIAAEEGKARRETAKQLIAGERLITEHEEWLKRLVTVADGGTKEH